MGTASEVSISITHVYDCLSVRFGGGLGIKHMLCFLCIVERTKTKGEFPPIGL